MSFDWLINWLPSWLPAWLIAFLIDCLLDCLIDWLLASLIAWLIDFLIGWLPDWLVDCLIDWLIDCSNLGRAYFCLLEGDKMDQADQQFNFVLSQVNVNPFIYRMAGQNHNGTCSIKPLSDNNVEWKISLFFYLKNCSILTITIIVFASRNLKVTYKENY